MSGEYGQLRHRPANGARDPDRFVLDREFGENGEESGLTDPSSFERGSGAWEVLECTRQPETGSPGARADAELFPGEVVPVGVAEAGHVDPRVNVAEEIEPDEREVTRLLREVLYAGVGSEGSHPVCWVYS
jgi:hypothetical protein